MVHHTGERNDQMGALTRPLCQLFGKWIGPSELEAMVRNQPIVDRMNKKRFEKCLGGMIRKAWGLQRLQGNP